MNQKKNIRLITVRPIHWVYLSIFVLVISPLLIATLYADGLYNGYVRTYIGPRIQRQFGFKMERRRMYYRGRQRLDVFVIESLEPNGLLAKAGVQNGDVPIEMFHLSDVAFYRRLQESPAKAVEIHLVNCAKYEESLKSDNLFMSDLGNRVVIPKGSSR